MNYQSISKIKTKILLVKIEGLLSILKRNIFLDKLLEKKIIKDMENKLKEAIKKQMTELMTEEKLFSYLGGNYVNEMKRDFKPLNEYVNKNELIDVLLFAGQEGGQNLYNKLYYVRNKSVSVSDLEKRKKLPPEFELKNEKLIKVLEDRANYIIKSVDKTTLQNLTEIISRGISEGKSLGEIQKEINQSIDEISLHRAETIVRTETTNAANMIEVELSKELGLQKHRWVTSNDSRVSDECLENEAEGWINIGEEFPGGVTQPPQHPNCRCFLVADIPEDFDFRNMEM